MGQDRGLSVDEARELLGRALRAIVAGDVGAIPLFTEDVVVDSPNMRVSTRAELVDQLADRAGALTNIGLTVDEVEVSESGVRATWTVTGDHTGEVLFNEDELFEASGRRIRLAAVTTACFRAGLISALRTDYDDVDLYRQVSRDPAGTSQPPAWPTRRARPASDTTRPPRCSTRTARPTSSTTSTWSTPASSRASAR